MYRNIMVPVDGSSFAREAVLHALRIASQSGATLHLVQVTVSPVFLGSHEGIALGASSLGELHSAELSNLYALAAECRAHSTLTVIASLERGPIVDALIGYARRHDVDLIVMRSHARRGLARVWFGSVADGLIRGSGIPVLVVRPPSVATALESGFHHQRILVPLDGSALAEQALGPAVSLARMDGATVTLLRIVAAWKHREPGELESSLGPAGANEVSEAQRYLESLLAGPGDRSIRVTRRVLISSDIASTILQIATDHEADVVALATRGRGAIRRATAGSVSDVVMRESTVSTLVIHPPVDVIAPADTVPELSVSAPL
ncbi:MAG: universal stress protein [Gemmatimonadaceae bacterium]